MEITYMKKLILPVIGVVAFSLAGCETMPESGSGSANPTPDTLKQSQMPAYCRGEAAAKFGQRPQEITTLPAERDQGMFTVYGQFPPEGQNATFFTCTFSANGEFVGVDKQ